MAELRQEQVTKPNPDPSTLTTDALLREIGNLDEHTQTRMQALRDIIDEKFGSVDRRLELVERQRVEQKADTKTAVDAALQAQKEAVREQTTASERAIAKSEAATSKQLEQLTQTFTTALNGVSVLLNDTKERVTKVETFKQGGKEQLSSVYAFVGFLVTLLILGTILAATGVFQGK